MPSYDVNIPGSGTYRVNSPTDLTDQQVWAALQQQLAASSNPLAGKTTAQLEAEKSAPFSISDVAVTGGESLLGAVKSLTDVFGAGSDVSKWLGKKREGIAEAYTPERKAEKAREAELTRRAVESGDTWEEVKQFGKTVLNSPIQSITSGLASSLPALATALATLPASAPAGLVVGVSFIARSLFGAAQGVGEAKGSMYDQAFQAYKNQGKDDAEASRLAEESQAYVAANLPLLAGSGALGALDALTGVESTANKALVKAFSEQAGKRQLTKEGVQEAFKQLPQQAAKAPTYLGVAGKGFLEEALPEALQGGYGQFVQNVAATRAGEETPYMQGVLGSAVQEGLVGGLTGTATSPLQMGLARGEYVADQFIRSQKAFFDAQDQAMAEMEAKQKQRAETESRLGIQQGKMLALPAPEKRVTEQEDPLAGLKNPVGNIQKSELSPKVVKYVNDYRKQNGLPPLKSYSIEDIKDAMPGVDPEGEKADLSRIIAAKTGFTGEQTYTPDDVVAVAQSKNIDTGTAGFSAFLERATGENDLAQMSQPQLYSAFKALDAMPVSEQPTILPVDTNASRFTQKQYDAAVDRVNESVSQQPSSRATVINDIKEATGLSEDRDAEAILNTALREGVLEENLKPAFQVSNSKGEVVGTFDNEKDAKKAAARKGYTLQRTTTREIASPTKAEPEKVRTPLPAGYEIAETETVSGVEPAGFQVVPEGRNKPLVTEETLEDARGKVERLQGLRQKAAEGFLKNVERDSATVKKGREALERMEAAGQADTEAYAVAKARQDRVERILGQRMERMLDRIEEYTSPLKTRPSGQKQVTRKGFTVKKGGKEIGTFPSRLEAEGSILAQLSDEELATLASDTRFGGIADRARVEQERRKSPEKGIRVFKSPITPEVRDEAAEALEQKLMPMLRKLGLMDVGLKVVRAIKNDADGSYAGKLVQIALGAKDPVRTLNHEAIHALKELGFFTPSQWAVLERKAKSEWINKYLAGKNAVYEGETMSRLEAYKRMGLSETDLMEEAIADAFADFAMNKPPAGLMSALMRRLNSFFEALGNAFRGLGFKTANDVFTQVERGELKPTVAEATPSEVKASLRPSEENAWKATPDELQQAVDMYEEDGILPYVSTGRIELPTEPEKFSLQAYNPEKHLSFDPTLGIPINKDGKVTVYYHTTKERALQIKNTKVIPSDGNDRIYLTNESGGAEILRDRGNFDQVLDGSTILLYVDPSMLQVDNNYENGRVDFFVPVTQGEFFNRKMKLQSIQKGRNEPITKEFSYDEHAKKIDDAVAKYKNADGAARRKMVADARKLLKKEHNVGSLLSENGKLEKTRIGDYNLQYEGNPVASQGLGLASAQKLSEKVSTCPRSAICEGLCLGETSGGNFMFGGAATEDVGDIQKSSFRAAARMMQYLKTEALIINPEAFTILLQSEIDSLKKWSASDTQFKKDPQTGKRVKVAKDIYSPAVRLNVTSDFKPEMFRSIIEGNPDVQFYDYTKLGSEPIATNHHLTYSSTGFGQIVKGEKVFFQNKAGQYDHNWATMRKRLDGGDNVAMAFSSKSALPKFILDEETGKKYRVLDGDLYDARFLDEVNPAKLEQGGDGVIVGLRNKAGNLSEKNATVKTKGFFAQYDPKTDGDTVTVPNQAQFKPERKTFPIEKLSLKEAPDTPEFKRWFGDSKVVNADGNPLVLYHGTPNFDGYEFKPSKKLNRSGNPDGYYFSPRPEDANEYAGEKEGAEIIPVYLSIKKPYLLGKNPHSQKMADVFEEELRKDNPNLGNDWIEEKVQIFKEGRFPNIDFPTDAMTRVIKAGGYDGMKDGRHWVAFDPTQIKSAIGNVGTYSPETGDIRYSLKDAPDTPAFKRWFGDSKIVDKDGNPLVVYHGTTAAGEKGLGIEQFKMFKGKIAKGAYFANNPEVSDIYARGYGGNVVPVYLSLQNPATEDDVFRVAGDATNSNQITKALKDAGYDGLIIKTGASSNYYVAFEPNQIKSAIGNVGTYSPETGDIRYSLKDAPDTPAFKRWFGNSKAVNEDGKPMLYHHGSAADFTEFLSGKAKAIFFAPEPVFAESFATEAKERLREQAFQAMDRDKRVSIIKEEADKALDEGRITQAEHKAMLDKAKRYAPTIKSLPYQIEGEILDNIEEYLQNKEIMYPVYLRVENPFDFENPSQVKKVVDFAAHNWDFKKQNLEQFLASVKGGIETGRAGTIEMDGIQDAIRRLGFDGFYVKEGGRKNLAVYSPTQIKSAIGNIGTYGVGKITEAQAQKLGMTADEATRAQTRGDMRLSLRDALPADIRDAIDATTHSAPRDDGWISRITSAKNNFSYTQFRDKLRANILNRYQRLGTYKTEIERITNAEMLADSSAEAAALMADDAAGVSASVLGVYDRQGGIPVYKNGFTSVWNDNGKIKGPAVIFAPLAKYGDPYVYQMFQFWAGVQRGKRLMMEGREKLFTKDDIARAEALEKQYPEFKSIFKEWNTFNNGLVQFLVDTGVVSKENAEIWTRDADYLPFYRALDDDQTLGPKVFQSMAGVTGPKKLKGGETQLADFLETIVRNTQSAVHAGMRNVAANRAIRDAVFLKTASKVEPGQSISGDHVLKIMEQGKPVYYNVTDPLFINAMKSLNMPEIPFIGILSAPANFLRSWVTKDPGFILANLMRDSMSAWVTSGEKITPILDTFKEFGSEVAKKSPELEALMNAGVIGGYDYAKGVKQSGELFREELHRRYGPPEPGFKPLKTVKSIWGSLEKLTEASDAATRIAVYKKVLAETGNEAEAIFRAKEIMNFNRKGSNPAIRILTAAVPFLNARMQGLDVLYRAGISPTVQKLAGQGVTAKQEELQRAFMVRGLTIAALSVMYALAVSGDDEYEKQEEETKDNNWIVPGLGLKIPTPFEVGFLFKTVPERVVRAYVNGTDTQQDFMDSMQRGVINTFAFNPVPQTIKPIAEAVVNFNSFTMRPIVGQGMADVEPEYQVGPGTSKIAEILGNLTGLSPLKLDHVYKGYTGTMGTYLSDLLDLGLNQVSSAPKASKRFEQMPVIKRFMADPEARGNITAYYKLKDDMDMAVRTSNYLLETAKPEDFEKYFTEHASLLATKDMVRQIDKDMKEIRKMRTMVQSSDMSPDEKRDTLTAIGQMEDAITQNAKLIKRAVYENK